MSHAEGHVQDLLRHAGAVVGRRDQLRLTGSSVTSEVTGQRSRHVKVTAVRSGEKGEGESEGGGSYKICHSQERMRHESINEFATDHEIVSW